MKTKNGKTSKTVKSSKGAFLKGKKGDAAAKKLADGVKTRKKLKAAAAEGTTAVKKKKLKTHPEGLIAMSDGDRTWLEGHLKGYRYRKRDNLGIVNNKDMYAWICINSGGGYSLVSITGFDKEENPIETHVFRLSADNAAKRINKILRKLGMGAGA